MDISERRARVGDESETARGIAITTEISSMTGWGLPFQNSLVVFWRDPVFELANNRLMAWNGFRKHPLSPRIDGVWFRGKKGAVGKSMLADNG